MQSISLFAAVLLALPASAGTPSATKSPQAKQARAADGLEALARRLALKKGALVAPGQLLRDAAFKKVSASPAPLRAEAESLLARADVSESQKFIVVYAMQKLPLKDKVAFSGRLLELKQAGKITQPVYLNGAFPTFEWSTTLAENYQDPSVIAFLQKARAASASADDKTMIDEMLSGRTAKDIRDLREDGQLPQPKKK